MTPAQLRRLARLESRAPEPEDDGQARERLMERYAVFAERLRAQPGYKPPTRAQPSFVPSATARARRGAMVSDPFPNVQSAPDRPRVFTRRTYTSDGRLCGRNRS
jgi:hypothetical protein